MGPLSACGYRFVDEITTLERAIDIVDHPIPAGMNHGYTVPCVQFLRHALVFILSLAKESLDHPTHLETNQVVAEEVWACIEPFITQLGMIYDAHDEIKAMAN